MNSTSIIGIIALSKKVNDNKTRITMKVLSMSIVAKIMNYPIPLNITATKTRPFLTMPALFCGHK